MNQTEYNNLRIAVIEAGYEEEIEWSRNIKPCDNSIDFFSEACWVILNSGMKEQIARKIWNRIRDAWESELETGSAFNHKGKIKAIDFVKNNHHSLFQNYLVSEDKIEFLLTIPYTGKITVYHLAKNLGHDCAKPDRHLVRIANSFGESVDEMCARISRESGDKICVVDTVIWRAANLGFI